MRYLTLGICNKCSHRRKYLKRKIGYWCNQHFGKPFLPDGAFRIFWDKFVLTFILWDIIVAPYEISFSTDPTGFVKVVNDIITCCFILDILLNFNTGYYSKGQVVVDRKKIATKYMKRWFWLDIIASFPYEIVADAFISGDDDEQISDGVQLLKIIRVFKLLKILRVLRVLKLSNVMKKFHDYYQFSSVVDGIISFIKLALTILFLAHFLACFWHLMAISMNEAENWLISLGMQDASTFDRYVTSLYWAVTTMITVGYGDISAVNVYEKIFNIVVMIIGCGVFAYVMNQIGTIVEKIDGGLSESK